MKPEEPLQYFKGIHWIDIKKWRDDQQIYCNDRQFKGSTTTSSGKIIGNVGKPS